MATIEVALAPPEILVACLPDHTQLPESDGEFVKNFQEHPQSVLLTDAILPVLAKIHPDGQFCIGQDSGIYWNLTEALTDNPVKGAISPDWYYVPNVPPLLNGDYRRSYVLWKEQVSPFIVIEFVSGDGREERSQTPEKGKFWVYERIIRPQYYAIYEVKLGRVEVYKLVKERFLKLQPNARGHYPINSLEVELGIWDGSFLETFLPWLRWWDNQGNLLLTGHERANAEAERANAEAERANAEAQRANVEAQRANVADERANAETQRANAADERAERLAAKLRELGIEAED